MTDAGRIDTSCEEKSDGFRIGGIDKKRTRITRVDEAVAADGNLMGESLGDVWYGLGAIAKVVNGDVEVERGDLAARETRGAAAFGNAQLEGCVFTFALRR